MSYRFDTPLISGAYHFGNRGLGVLGSQVPSTGTNGPGYIYNDLSLPADNNKEYSGFVETPPGVGTFFAFEDSSFTYTGPTTSFVYRLREDGVDKGTQTVTINTDDTPAATITWSEVNDTFSLSGTIPYVAAFSWIEANDVHSISVAVSGTIGSAFSWTEADDITSIAATLRDNVAVNWVESNDTHSITGNVASATLTATMGWTETDDIVGITATVASSTITAQAAWIEASDVCNIVAGINVLGASNWVEANDSHYAVLFVEGAGSPLPANIQVKFKSNKYKITFKRE